MLGRKREWIVAHAEAALSRKADDQFASLCERRGAGIPIAYILGSAGFYGRNFAVNEKVLIPRPETEHLVDEAIEFIKKLMDADPRRTARVLDVGVGCGAIACTVAAETRASVEGTDASGAAVAIASENARRLNVIDRCRFHHGNLVDPVRGRHFDVVIANLPYVPTQGLPKPPDPASFEPRQALDGGLDGLDLYRRFLLATPALEDGGLLLLEAAPPTIAALTDLVRTSLPQCTIEVGKDYGGRSRYIKALSRKRGLPGPFGDEIGFTGTPAE